MGSMCDILTHYVLYDYTHCMLEVSMMLGYVSCLLQHAKNTQTRFEQWVMRFSFCALTSIICVYSSYKISFLSVTCTADFAIENSEINPQ